MRKYTIIACFLGLIGLQAAEQREDFIYPEDLEDLEGLEDLEDLEGFIYLGPIPKLN